MMAFHQFASVKNLYPKIYFTFEMQPNIFFNLFLVPYAFTCCNLRVGEIPCFCVQYDYFLALIFHEAQVNEQWKRIRRSQHVQANIAGTQ